VKAAAHTHGGRRGEWRVPHRSFREIVSLVLWWFVVIVGLIAAVAYVANQP
jgi:hypothetical protein